MVFEIPLLDGRIVYMQGKESEFESIVFVSASKFFSIWHNSQKLDQVVTAQKYPEAESAFLESKKYPVPIVSAGIFDYDQKGYMQVKLTDGITRTSWLIDNKAQSFPLACSRSQVGIFERELSTNSPHVASQSHLLAGNGRGKLSNPSIWVGISSNIRRLFKKLY